MITSILLLLGTLLVFIANTFLNKHLDDIV